MEGNPRSPTAAETKKGGPKCPPNPAPPPSPKPSPPLVLRFRLPFPRPRHPAQQGATTTPSGAKRTSIWAISPPFMCQSAPPRAKARHLPFCAKRTQTHAPALVFPNEPTNPHFHLKNPRQTGPPARTNPSYAKRTQPNLPPSSILHPLFPPPPPPPCPSTQHGK
jgi:hypothetical protein